MTAKRRRRRRRNPAHEALLRKARKRYSEFVELQGGEHCAICGSEPKTRRLHIDHDHTTMELRGLLCFNCNSLLRPRWSAETLRRAADYLENPPLRGCDDILTAAPAPYDPDFDGANLAVEKERDALGVPSPPLAEHTSRQEG